MVYVVAYLVLGAIAFAIAYAKGQRIWLWTGYAGLLAPIAFCHALTLPRDEVAIIERRR